MRLLCVCSCHDDAVDLDDTVMAGGWCSECFEFHKAAIADHISSGILTTDPDSDKDTTMTTLPVPTDTPDDTGVKTLVRGDEVIFARTAEQNERLLARASRSPATAGFVQKAKTAEQTGIIGLYIEAIAHTASYAPFAHMRFFVVGDHLYTYNRSVGDTRANWRHRKTASLQAALNTVQAVIEKDTVKLFGHPVLVELTPDDISNIESGQLPPARFRGQYRIERDFGKYTFGQQTIPAKPIPAKLIEALRGGNYVKPTAMSPF